MRWFVAVEVPSEGLRALSATASAAPAHLTLRFLGEVPVSQSDPVRSALAVAAAEIGPFPYELGGIGAFPQLDRPRVVWAGVRRGADGFRRLRDAVDAALERAGIPRERTSFVPHVTLFRVRGRSDAERGRSLQRDHQEDRLGTGVAAELLLKESDLLPSGAVHTTVAAFPLTGAPVPESLRGRSSSTVHG